MKCKKRCKAISRAIKHLEIDIKEQKKGIDRDRVMIKELKGIRKLM